MHILYNALASSSTHQSMKAPGLVGADANSQHRWAMVHKFIRLCWALFRSLEPGAIQFKRMNTPELPEVYYTYTKYILSGNLRLEQLLSSAC